MISRIEGELLSVQAGGVEVRCGAFTYQVQVPAADEPRLADLIGEPVTFHALHYLESQAQGASYRPRLIGFATAEQRAFFELLTSVKGMGARKALRAMTVPCSRIAEAIATKDLDLLTSLPEIGKRVAETIVAQLDGKVDRFVELKPSTAAGDPAGPPMVHDALAAMVQLGEPRSEARQLLERALAVDPTLDSADALIAAAYRLKEA